MAQFDTRIALKPYLEIIEKNCRELSKQELTDVILGLAKDQSTSRRISFLQKFKSFLPVAELRETMTADVNTILHDIQALKESILERIEKIENGEYDELDDWDWEDAHYDDEPEYASDEQIEDLIDLFEEAGDLFLNDEIEHSKIAYQALFELKDELDGYGFVLPELEIDLREERARYARCVYDASDEHNRLDEFAAAMNLDASSRYDKQKINDAYPLLQDVIDTREGDIPDLKSFFRAWKNLLLKKGTQARPASLLTEAVYYLEGFNGIGKLARKWGNIQPHGYLFWLNRLEQENRLTDMVNVSKEALDVLKPGAARENISNFLIIAGKASGDMDNVLEGKQEKFFSRPCDENLLDFHNTAVEQKKRNESLARILAYFAKQEGMGDGEKSLYLKALLMAGQFDDAWNEVKESKSLGWSYGLNIGLVFGAAATVIADHNDNAGTIERLLTEYADKTALYSYQIFVTEDNRAKTFYEEIIKGLQQVKFPASKLKQYFNWALNIGKKRVDNIVSNQHRGAYERAASALGVLAEVHAAQGDKEKAANLIHKYCKEKYNRHIAFKREVKIMISRSRLLQDVGITL